MNPQFVQFGPTGQSGYYDQNNTFIPMDKTTFDTMFSQMQQNVNNPYIANDNYTMASTTNPSSMPAIDMSSVNKSNNSPMTFPNSTNMGMFASNIGVPNNQEIVNPNQVNPYIAKDNYTMAGTNFDSSLKKPEMPAKEGGLSGEQKGSLIGAGINMGSKLIRGLAPDRYDQRVGMEDPNAVGTILGDTTFTQMGSSIMPGIGTAIGGGLDLIKNIITFSKKKDAYNAGKRKADFTDYQRNLVSNRESDYTGLARHGIKAKNPYLRDYGKFSSKMKKR